MFVISVCISLYFLQFECFLCFLCLRLYLFFFFKQKTAYEMRISDWSSDVCSSDLITRITWAAYITTTRWAVSAMTPMSWVMSMTEIGRASCRERVCQYV